MILLPGSFSGRMSSPRPQRGPLYKKRKTLQPKAINQEKHIFLRCLKIANKKNYQRSKHTKKNAQSTYLPKKRISFPIFIRETATVFKAPLVSTNAS